MPQLPADGGKSKITFRLFMTDRYGNPVILSEPYNNPVSASAQITFTLKTDKNQVQFYFPIFAKWILTIKPLFNDFWASFGLLGIFFWINFGALASLWVHFGTQRRKRWKKMLTRGKSTSFYIPKWSQSGLNMKPKST